MKKAVVLLLGTGVVAAYVFRKQISSAINSVHVVVEDHGSLTPMELLELVRDKLAEARAFRESNPTEEGSF